MPWNDKLRHRSSPSQHYVQSPGVITLCSQVSWIIIKISNSYLAQLVIGPITSLFNVSQLPWEYTTWATVYIALKLFHSQYQPLPSHVPIYSPGWREAIIVKYLAQGHKCHDHDSNPHSGDLAPELEFDALNHLAMTLYSLNETLAKIFSESNQRQ